jgi:hypothetical protein
MTELWAISFLAVAGIPESRWYLLGAAAVAALGTVCVLHAKVRITMIKMMMRFLGTGAVAAAVAFAAPAASAATPLPVVYGQSCNASWCDPDVRPHGTERWIFGAGNQYITRMTWGHWNATNARGTGTIHVCPTPRRLQPPSRHDVPVPGAHS